MRHLFVHTASVKRSSTTVSGQQRAGGLSTVISSMRCRFEGMTEKERESVLGRLASATYKMSWGDEALQTGDVVVWNGGEYDLHEITRDNTRPTLRYQTGIVGERH